MEIAPNASGGYEVLPDRLWFPTQVQALAYTLTGQSLTEQEAHMAAREAEYVAAIKAANRQIWDGINALVAAQREWNALDYSATLDSLEGATAADVGAVVFDTTNALVGVLNAGHATNMAKLL
jgi:hypothetical protein